MLLLGCTERNAGRRGGKTLEVFAVWAVKTLPGYRVCITKTKTLRHGGAGDRVRSGPHEAQVSDGAGVVETIKYKNYYAYFHLPFHHLTYY